MFLLYQLDCHLSLKMSLKMISRKELEPCCCYCCFHQYPALPDYYKFILITVLTVMTLIEAIRLFLGYTGNLQEKVAPSLTQTWNKKSARQEAVIPLMCVFVEGARVGWILAAEHPAAVSSHPVSAVQRSHSHSAPGEGRSHSSRHVHTHTGTIRFFP